MFVVYVIHSQTHNKIYIGYTADLESRLYSHNHSTGGYTKRFRPWAIMYSENLPTKTEAMLREKQLKTAARRKFIWEIIAKKISTIEGGR